jgi:hypothetical protein
MGGLFELNNEWTDSSVVNMTYEFILAWDIGREGRDMFDTGIHTHKGGRI